MIWWRHVKQIANNKLNFMDINSEDIHFIFSQVKKLKEPETTEECVYQLAIVGQAVQRCQLLLEHLVGGVTDPVDFALYVSEYREMVNMEQKLVIKQGQLPTNAKLEAMVADTLKKDVMPWWKYTAK